jgi:hypothetical protein
MTHNNTDMTGIKGTLLTFTTYLVSLMDIDIMLKIGVMGVGIVSAISTIVYNIKKIKKLDDDKR